jgi:hypothetical protein
VVASIVDIDIWTQCTSAAFTANSMYAIQSTLRVRGPCARGVQVLDLLVSIGNVIEVAGAFSPTALIADEEGLHPDTVPRLVQDSLTFAPCEARLDGGGCLSLASPCALPSCTFTHNQALTATVLDADARLLPGAPAIGWVDRAAAAAALVDAPSAVTAAAMDIDGDCRPAFSTAGADEP